MIVEFTVTNALPPKKDGGNSMWGKRKPTETGRLQLLRRAAKKAFGENAPLEHNISLTIEIHVGHRNNKSTGDLDNFITGICDGLMRSASKKFDLDPSWSMPDLVDIHPHTWCCIRDDSKVMSIHASKIVGTTAEPWYRIVVKGDQ